MKSETAPAMSSSAYRGIASGFSLETPHELMAQTRRRPNEFAGRFGQ